MCAAFDVRFKNVSIAIGHFLQFAQSRSSWLMTFGASVMTGVSFWKGFDHVDESESARSVDSVGLRNLLGGQ